MHKRTPLPYDGKRGNAHRFAGILLSQASFLCLCLHQPFFRIDSKHTLGSLPKSPPTAKTVSPSAGKPFAFDVQRTKPSADDTASLNTLHKAALDDQVQENQRNQHEEGAGFCLSALIQRFIRKERVGTGHL